MQNHKSHCTDESIVLNPQTHQAISLKLAGSVPMWGISHFLA
jgi:hypothetical protein